MAWQSQWRTVTDLPVAGGGHAAGDPVPEHPAALAACGPTRSRERRRLGRRRDAGASCDAARVPSGRQPPVAVAQPPGEAVLPLSPRL